ncbi:MAG: VOC family protein [Planctomycetota bacterium]
MAIKPIPDGYHTATPYLIVKGAARAIDFYKQAFGAEEIMKIGGPGGTVAHAEIKIGDSRIMLSDEHPEMGYKGPQAYGGSPASLHLYVENVDRAFPRAIAAGAKEKTAVQDWFYGDRSGTVTDPFGHVWTLSTHKEDVPPAEIERRAANFMTGQSGM